MADKGIIARITDLVIKQTVKQRIPTVIFLTDIEKGDLIKNIIRTIKGGNQDENTFSADDWQMTAEIMQNLAEIPLLLKETTNTDEIIKETTTFITEMNGRKSLVIINSKEKIFTPFTEQENICIIVI